MRIRTKEQSGVDILGILQIIFVVLKLTGLIAWSWWLVLIPLFIKVFVFFIALATIYAYRGD